MELIVLYPQRIDKYLTENTIHSRNQIQNFIAKNLIQVNNKIISKANFFLKINDKITLNIDDFQKEIVIKPQNINLDILYQDQDIIVINKANNMVVHPAVGNWENTIVNGLLWHFKELSNVNGPQRLGVVHRLDKNTTGVMVFAKNNFAHQNLTNQFEQRQVEKIYYAIVKGYPKNKIYHINLPIGIDPKNRLKKIVTKHNSKYAITHVYFEKQINDIYSLVKCRLETGRTHQIRVHLKHIGLPILGDELYDNYFDSLGQRLHSYSISFIHPTTKLKVTFKADIPKKFSILF